MASIYKHKTPASPDVYSVWRLVEKLTSNECLRKWLKLFEHFSSQNRVIFFQQSFLNSAQIRGSVFEGHLLGIPIIWDFIFDSESNSSIQICLDLTFICQVLRAKSGFFSHFRTGSTAIYPSYGVVNIFPCRTQRLVHFFGFFPRIRNGNVPCDGAKKGGNGQEQGKTEEVQHGFPASEDGRERQRKAKNAIVERRIRLFEEHHTDSALGQTEQNPDPEARLQLHPFPVQDTRGDGPPARTYHTRSRNCKRRIHPPGRPQLRLFCVANGRRIRPLT